MVGYLENWVDAIVVRHSDINVVKNMVEHAKIPVINAMTSENHLEQCCPIGYGLNNIKVHTNIEDAVAGKDIICTDSIPKQAREDFKGYQITLQHMQKANPGAILNPCPPFYRGEEVSEDVINSAYFVGYGFKNALLPMQQAILCYLLNK